MIVEPIQWRVMCSDCEYEEDEIYSQEEAFHVAFEHEESEHGGD